MMPRSNLEHAVGIFLIGCALASASFFNAYSKEAIYALALFSSISVLLEPLLGLTLAVASLPWFGFTLIPDAFSLTKGVTALTIVALALRLGMGILAFPNISQSLRWYAFALVFSLTTTLFTPGFNELFLEAIQTPVLAGFFPFLFVIILRNYDQLRFLSVGGIIAGSALVVAILVLGIEAFVTSEVQMRLSAGTNENELGQILTVCLALCLVVGAETTFTWRVIVAIAGLLLVYAILLTQSRGTWVGIIFATGVTTFFVPGLSLKNRVTFVGSFVLLGLVSIFLVLYDVGGVGEFFEARTAELFQQGASGSAGRVEWIWPLWFNTFLENPLIGIGVGGSASVVNVNPHNDVLSLLGERGLLGFSLYMVFQVLIFRESLKNSIVSFRCIAIWILVFLMTSGMFSESIFLKSYGLGIGLVEVLNNIGIRTDTHKT
ncbi:MAG: O-antigen ligase family protein [Desulfomonile sp.]